MELELGFKITHHRDDITTDFRIAKDHSGPLFMSKETASKFILIGHIKGYKREHIDIDINEAGNQLTIKGKKPVQEMVMRGWIMHKKDVEFREFKKVFWIPDVINLNRTKAKFKEEESKLIIIMPKLEKGMLGIEIQEVKEQQTEQEEHGTTNEAATDKIKELPPGQEVMQEAEEVREQEGPGEEESSQNGNDSEGFNLSSKMIFAGSTTFLVTLLLLIINLLRSSKR